MKYIKLLLALILILAIAGAIYFYPSLQILTGYSAKMACSCKYVADRAESAIIEEDLSFSPINLASVTYDDIEKSATASLFGLKTKKAVYRSGHGCTLLQNKNDELVALPSRKRIRINQSAFWPEGPKIRDTSFSNVDLNHMNVAIDQAFKEEYKTRAIVVIYNGEILTEKYANGIDQNTRLLGWSMTKSITNALIGILVKNDQLNIQMPAPVPDWHIDERSNITINDLMQMNSGQQWDEEYFSMSDVTQMLYDSEDIYTDAGDNPAEFDPGTHWEYSSGTTNILSGIIRDQFKTEAEYLQFPYDSLFMPLHMHSALIETDAEGTQVGSSYGWATARDWAKFGLLYLYDGVWNGQRILPEGWVDYSKKEAPNSNGVYGAQFWLNKRQVTYPDVSEHIFSANGFQGQHVFVIPEKELVVVRLGLVSEFNANDFLKNVISSIK